MASIGNKSGPTQRVRLGGLYLAGGLLLVAVLTQATILARARVFGASANLVLVLVVVWSLLRSVDEALILAFLGGLLIDLIAGLPLGGSALALMIVTFLAAIGEGSMFQGHVLLALIPVALATPIYGWFILLVRQFNQVPVAWLSTTIGVIIPELLLNVALAALIYPGLRRLLARFGADRLEW